MRKRFGGMYLNGMSKDSDSWYSGSAVDDSLRRIVNKYAADVVVWRWRIFAHVQPLHMALCQLWRPSEISLIMEECCKFLMMTKRIESVLGIMMRTSGLWS